LALSSGAGLLAPKQALTLTDMAVARYLEGGVAIDAVTVETVLNMRQSLVLDLVYAHGSWAQIVLITFLLGALLYLGLLVQRAIRLSHIVGQSYLWRRHAAADLRLSDHIAVPFSTRGLWRRHVVVPSSMVTDTKRLRMVLAHEFEHIRRGDLEWELISVLARPLFFWNPGYWLWARSLERLRELGCDQALLERGRVSANAYGHCLLDVCESALARQDGKVLSLSPRVSLLDSSIGKRNQMVLAHRISALAFDRDAAHAGTKWFWFGGLAAALLITLSATVLQRPSDWSQDRLMLSTIANLERFENTSIGARPLGF